jgi:hypothetical protein
MLSTVFPIKFHIPFLSGIKMKTIFIGPIIALALLTVINGQISLDDLIDQEYATSTTQKPEIAGQHQKAEDEVL